MPPKSVFPLSVFMTEAKWPTRLFWSTISLLVAWCGLTLRRQNVIPIGAKLDETGTKRKEKEGEHNLLLRITLGQISSLFSLNIMWTKKANSTLHLRDYKTVSKTSKMTLFLWFLLSVCLAIEVKEDIVTKYGSPSINLNVHFELGFPFKRWKMTLNFYKKKSVLGKVRTFFSLSRAPHRSINFTFCVCGCTTLG